MAGPSLRPRRALGLGQSDELEVVFWQSIVNSTNPADFEAYLAWFPNEVFPDAGAEQVVALRNSAGGTSAAVGPRVGGVGSPASGALVLERLSWCPARRDLRCPVIGGDVEPSARRQWRGKRAVSHAARVLPRLADSSRRVGIVSDRQWAGMT